VPHPQEPVIRVWAEAASEAAALGLVTEYADLVEELKG
jgi:phosphomannomutase